MICHVERFVQVVQHFFAAHVKYGSGQGTLPGKAGQVACIVKKKGG